MNKDITNLNYKKEVHGYQEWYYNNILYYRGNYKHNQFIGYQEWYNIYQTRYHIT